VSDELDGMWRDVSTIMGEHTCKEVVEGVWEHTFTPVSTYTSTQATDSMTADELLRIADGIKDQRTQEWLEEYERYSHASMLRELEEMSKPLYDTPYMRYLASCPQIVMRSSMPMPYRAEGASTEAWSMHVANATPIRKWQRKVKARKRTRRKHRAAFRRRKRGLA
jgi:hypothetical protein